MTNEEANKVIAEYINSDGDFVFNMKKCYRHDGVLYYPFCESLDALVPVWEKARISNVCQFDFNRIGNNYEFTIFQDRPDKNYGNQWYAKEPTLQEAAAHATALCIKELK